MDWNKAIEECPSNKNGKCYILPNNTQCLDNVNSGKCPIKKLEQKEQQEVIKDTRRVNCTKSRIK